MKGRGDPPPGPRPLLRPAPVKVRGRLGPQAPAVDGEPTGLSRGRRQAAPTSEPAPLAPPGPRRPDHGPAPGSGAFRAGGGTSQRETGADGGATRRDTGTRSDRGEGEG